MHVATSLSSRPASVIQRSFTPASAILTYLASSTRLSASEKEGFMRQLAELEAANALTAKILKQIMMAIRFAEEAHDNARFARQPVAEVMEAYQSMLKEIQAAKSGTSPATNISETPETAWQSVALLV